LLPLDHFGQSRRNHVGVEGLFDPDEEPPVGAHRQSRSYLFDHLLAPYGDGHNFALVATALPDAERFLQGDLIELAYDEAHMVGYDSRTVTLKFNSGIRVGHALDGY